MGVAENFSADYRRVLTAKRQLKKGEDRCQDAEHHVSN